MDHMSVSVKNKLKIGYIVHGSGRGSRLMKAVVAAGITFDITTRAGTRNEERRIKNRGSLARSCPICLSELKSKCRG